MAAMPKITVVTPVFNCREHVAETLASVLSQEYPALEYIIVDGGSSDGTLDIIRAFQARKDFPQRISLVISEPDQGMYDALAKGFQHATGEILCYLNADDLFEYGALQSVGEYFAQHPEVQVIYHEDLVLVDGWRYPNARQPEDVDTVDLLSGHVLFQDGVFWRRAPYEAAGGIRRDLALAGDFDLWLRLSAHCRFVRRPRYVSSFRVRRGQLSTQTGRYRQEMDRSIAEFRATAPTVKRGFWALQSLFRKAWRKCSKRPGNERLFFPIDFANFPPLAAITPSGTHGIPRSPIDGKPAERFLFSTPDTRFGERKLNYIYLDERHGIAITHPRITAEKLDALYATYYSSPPTAAKHPEGNSAYRKFNGLSLWERLLFCLPVGHLSRVLFPSVCSDNTLGELITVLKASNVDTAIELRFLDIGCFEGRLLDQIRGAMPWRTFGLEPNRDAVEKALRKGHQVFCGRAEDAGSVLAEGQHFDVIHLGQSIEHLDDPVGVIDSLQQLLAPGGVIVVSTPNLDSREIDWFGPTWAHWHAPYHRYIFSKEGLLALARQVDLCPLCLRTFSNPYWTAMSLALNAMGLAGSVSHAVDFSPAIMRKARRINFWKTVFWNRLGKGDYSLLVMGGGSDGLPETT